jgi:hypothetical protein
MASRQAVGGGVSAPGRCCLGFQKGGGGSVAGGLHRRRGIGVLVRNDEEEGKSGYVSL